MMELSSLGYRDSDSILMDSSPRSEVINEILEKAIEIDSSDIHIHLSSSACTIRVRVLGVMRELMSIERTIGEDVLSGLMSLSSMDNTDYDIEQDGAFSVKRFKCRFRASYSRVVDGQYFVLRVINSNLIPKLDSLSLSDEYLNEVRRVIKKKQGLVVISGPTGQGKSTTMQAIIEEIKDPSINIISIENPVEREIAGVLQKEVTYKVSWKDAIRSTLRQDPDVVFIGEVRDSDSAGLAIELARTGHLVLTTVHANNSYEITKRFEELDVSSKELSSCLLLGSAQRLVQKLCETCKIPSGEGFIKGKGCCSCKESPIDGVSTQIPIVEFISNEAKSPKLSELVEAYVESGVVSLLELDRWS